MRFKELLKPTKKKILLTIMVFLLIRLIIVFPPVFYVAQSTSMSPAINRGDIIFVSYIDFSDVEVGDIVLVDMAEYNRIMLYSRVVSIDDNTFDTRGDANAGQHAFEKNIPSDKIRGVITGSIPMIGFLEIYHISSIILALLIYLIFSLFFIKSKPDHV